MLNSMEQKQNAAEMKMMMAQSQEEASAARREYRMAEYEVTSRIKKQHKELYYEIVFNRKLMNAMKPIVQNYAPDKAGPSAPNKTEGQPTIVTKPIDTTKKDTSK
jgi:hypothetical protein